jgi:hypothetical protein
LRPRQRVRGAELPRSRKAAEEGSFEPNGLGKQFEVTAYRDPLLEAAKLLDRYAGPDCAHVLLGSIASAKYIGPLLDVFGRRLLFPSEFVGRGDMSRGGLMLRCARSRTELTYVPVEGAVRHGERPPKLPKWRKQ